MKILGQITATLALLLGLYLLGYWVLIKNHWAHKFLSDPTDPFRPPKTLVAVSNFFQPIIEFEFIFRVDVPLRHFLTGHWRSDTSSDFVTIGPNQICRFQLGEFAFDGKAKYDRAYRGFIMEFTHQKSPYIFTLSRPGLWGQFAATPIAFANQGKATARVRSLNDDPFERKTAYETTLTKQTPNAPAP